MKYIRIYNYSATDTAVQGLKRYSLKVGNQSAVIRTANYVPPQLSCTYFQTVWLDRASTPASVRRTGDEPDPKPRAVLEPSVRPLVLTQGVRGACRSAEVPDAQIEAFVEHRR